MKKSEAFEVIENIDGYYDFTKGVHIQDGEIKSWLSRCFERCAKIARENPELQQTSSSTCSGNGRVTVDFYKQSNGKYTVTSTVSRSYSSKTLIDVKPDDNEE